MRISKVFPDQKEEFILEEIKKNISVDIDIETLKDGFKVQFLAPLKRNEEFFLTSLEESNAIDKSSYKEFNPELATFKRHRSSITQGNYSIVYNNISITTVRGESSWFDNIELKEDGSYHGYSDEYILKHIKDVYNNGDIYNLISPLKYNYKLN